MDLDSGYLQFKILKNLSDIFLLLVPRANFQWVFYHSEFTGQHQSFMQLYMCNLFLELLLRCLKIYIDNLLAHLLKLKENTLLTFEKFLMFAKKPTFICGWISIHLWSLRSYKTRSEKNWHAVKSWTPFRQNKTRRISGSFTTVLFYASSSVTHMSLALWFNFNESSICLDRKT